MPAALVPLRTYRILTAAIMGALVIIGVVLTVVVRGHRTDREGHVVHTHAPSPVVYLIIVAIGLVMAVVVQAVGYRIPALSPRQDLTESRATGMRAYQQTMFLRLALSEIVAIVSIALLFAVQSNTVLPYVVGAVIAELLLAYHVWPGQRLIERMQQRLDRDGGHSDLANALAGTPI